MTREEAIVILENEKKCVNRASKNDYCNRDCYNCELVKTDTEILNALDMAIRSLEQESILDKIRAEIDRQEKWLMHAGCNAYNVDIAFNAIRSVVKESEVEND